MVKFISAFICPVVYIGKGIGCVSGASVEESMRTAVRLLKAADLTDLNLGLARSLHWDLKGRATGPFRRAIGGEGSHPHAQGRGQMVAL